MADKEKKEKKGFWKEFKEFITRGNVLDMAVGIIVGGAFTAIVTALCDNILKPIINWIIAAIVGTDSLSEAYTFLKRVEVDGVVDLSQSIYIDWGTFINAIINFLLIALVLFLIIKALMKVQQMRDQAKAALEEAEEKRKAENEAAEKAAQQQAVAAAAAPAAEANKEATAAEEKKEAAKTEEPQPGPETMNGIHRMYLLIQLPCG